MTRIFCKPRSIGRGLAGLMFLQLAMGLLTLIDATPVEAASRTERKKGFSRLTVARLTGPRPLVHDATVSILSAPPAFWQRPAGDPTALNPAAARCHHPASTGMRNTFFMLPADTTSGPAPSATVDALTTTFYVSDSPAGAEWSSEPEPLADMFSRD